MSEKIEFAAKVAEFTGDPKALVPLDPSLVQRVSGNDENPQFVVVAIESGVSKNKRRWGPKVLEKIAEQVKSEQPVGYLGHIRETDDPYILPDPQTIWLGAVVTHDSRVSTLHVKGYNLPNSKVRDWVPRGALNSVSVKGEADLVSIGGIYDVSDFKLESIDWARKGKEGMRASVVAVTAEMEDTVDPKEIAALTESDLRQHNSTVVELIERKATDSASEKVQEMEAAAAAIKPEVDTLGKIRELLKIEEGKNPLETITSLVQRVEELGREKVKGALDEILSSKVKNDKAREIVKRLVGEMAPADDESIEDYKKRCEEAIDKELEDESIKSVISEMEESVGGKPLKSSSSGSPSGSDGGKKSNENIEIYEATSTY